MSVEKKNITIRGVDQKTYDEFSQKMKVLNKTMGESLTELMINFLESDAKEPKLSSNLFVKKAKLPLLNISYYDNLIISNQDLIEAKSRLEISHIKNFKIRSDITKENFEKYIVNISHCDQVIVPKTLPKLILFSRINHCNNVEIYD